MNRYILYSEIKTVLHKKKCTAGIKENVQDAENLQSLKTAFVQVMNEFSKALQNQNDENKKRDKLLEQMLQKLGSTTINANNSNNNFNEIPFNPIEEFSNNVSTGWDEKSQQEALVRNSMKFQK